MAKLNEKEVDLTREQAFRRGYTHGVREALDHLAPKLSDAERDRLMVWSSNVLGPWSRLGSEAPFLPPQMPDLDKDA